MIGSLVGTRNDLQDRFALHAQGRTRVVAEGRRLEEVNACFDEALAGDDRPARCSSDLTTGPLARSAPRQEAPGGFRDDRRRTGDPT